MKKQYWTKIVIPLFILFCLPLISAAQSKKMYVGVNVANEFNEGFENGTMAAGIAIERKLTRRSGIETGLYYRSHISQYEFFASNNLMAFSVSEKYLSLPLLYKFYTKIIDISAGPSLDYFVGWKQKSGSGDLKVNTYSFNPKYALGIMVKAGKSFALGKQFYIQPELRFNRLIPNYRTFIGFGTTIKYSL